MYHDYNIPDRGATNWHEPLNENFRQIDADVEIRDTEGNLGSYNPAANAKFLATDTGRTFLGDGSDWSPLPAVGARGTPDIVCREDGETSYAETAAETFIGSDVFDAAQQAVDALLADSPGNFSLVFEPGYYVIDSRLSITGEAAKDVDRVVIAGKGSTDGAYFETKSLSGGTILEIDPEAGDIADDRIFGVQLANLNFDHRDSPGTTAGGASSAGRDEDGIFVNDTRDLHIKRVGLQGLGRALHLRNIWQAEVDYLMCRISGSDTANKSPILVETGDTTSSRDWWDSSVHNASNHIQFRNLQGHSSGYGDGFVKMSTPDVNGREPRIRSVGILHPNVECNNSTFLHNHANAWVVISACQLKEPDPLIDQGNGRTALNGGVVESPKQLLSCTDGHAMINGVDMSSATTSSKPMVYFNGGWFSLSNVRTYGGKRAVEIDSANVVNITGLHAQRTNEAALYLQNVGLTNVSGITAKKTNVVDSESESPIQLVNNGPTSISNVVASVDTTAAPRPVISDRYGSGPVDFTAIVPGGESTRPISTNENTSLVKASGSAEIPGNATSVTVTHKLPNRPSPGGIRVTPTGPLENATSFYVSNINGETFDIIVDTVPGRAIPFGWNASL